MTQRRFGRGCILLVAVAICRDAPGSPPLVANDVSVLQTAFSDFVKRPDSIQYSRNNPHAYVAIAPQTEPAADRGYDGMYEAFISEEVPSVPKAAISDLLARNRQSYDTSGLGSTDGSALRVFAVDETSFAGPFTAPTRSTS